MLPVHVNHMAGVRNAHPKKKVSDEARGGEGRGALPCLHIENGVVEVTSRLGVDSNTWICCKSCCDDVCNARHDIYSMTAVIQPPLIPRSTAM